MSEFQIRDGNLIASFDLENEDGDIDCCKLFKVTHGVANEMGMFVDYVATNKIIKDQSIQLAEKDQAIESLEELNKSLGQTCNNDAKEIERLNKQLAEKEEQYVQSLIKLEKEYDEQLEKQAKIHYGHLKEKDQDKISFAVEQLEKVKSNLGWFPAVTDEDVKILKNKQREHFNKRLMNFYTHNKNFIDDLICELKEGK